MKDQENMKSKAPAGGAAAAGGMNFQHRAAAWVATRILAERAAANPWHLPVEISLEWLQCETKQPVDDLLVGVSNDGLIFAQIKQSLELSKLDTSELASALDQFVRQFIICRSKTTRMQPVDRPLDPKKDRLVLITSPTSSERIRLHFNSLLERVRGLSQQQHVDDAARNEEEKQVLSVVKTHVVRSWLKVSGVYPSDDEFLEFLSLIRVQILCLDKGCTDELEAKNLLRNAILGEPKKADAAWSLLVNLCAGLATHRSGTNRKNLQQELLNSGIELQASRSYRTDIECLKKHSKQVFDSLSYLARIRVGSTEIKIQRPCTQELKRAAEEKSILIVGEPGAGKTGALHDLVESFIEEDRDHVFLAVDRLAARSLGYLREEIGLNHELTEVLDNWPGLQPAFLVIDALDAARGDPAGAIIRELIRWVVEKDGRWRVLASIRKFDLRYGEEIKRLFAGEPLLEFNDTEFRNVRHLNIPRLSEDEIGQISSQSTELHGLLSSAPHELHNLLRVPFNLRLAAELLGSSDIGNEIMPIKTQLELLNKYWLHRVFRSGEDEQGDAREAFLRKMCERMVVERALRIDRSVVARLETSVLLQDLLSTQVIIEWQALPGIPPDQYILAFSHNVLFDYATARLLLRGDPGRVAKRLLNDPDIIVMIRPSFLLHFRHLWTVNNLQFWDLVFRINRETRIPGIGKLIGPSVAAELAKVLSSFDPLFMELENPHAETQGFAEQALRHLVGALLAAAPGEAKLLGTDAGPWCDLIERVSRSQRPSVVYMVQPLLTTICEHPEYFTPEQRDAAGQTAHRNLEFAWSQPIRNQWLVIQTLRCVCRTFESIPASSATLIRRCLEPEHLSQFGFEEMPWLADEVNRLISLDPELIEEIYRAAFSYCETSKESTSIGQSRILPLSSNRRQDYEMALYKLAEVFPRFLECTPESATRALVSAMEAYVVQGHAPASGNWQEEVFDFNGHPGRLLTDYSVIWDHYVYRHEGPMKMLDTFHRYLEELSKQQDRIEDIRELVKIIVSENRLAVVWNRLLRLGSSFPRTLGREILPLSWAMPILIGYDTTTQCGLFLKAIFPTLDRDERELIERTILRIPGTVSMDRPEVGENIRNRLLGCLASESIVTAEARGLLDELLIKNAIPSNDPPVRIGGQMGVPFSEEDYLADMGVPVEEEANKKIRELECPVKEFADKHLNLLPTAEEVTNVLPALRELHSAVSGADAEGVHPKQRDHGWHHLAAACARIARTEKPSCNNGTCSFVRSVLLEACSCPEPIHNPEDDAQFDKFPSWGPPAARTEAANGIVVLARHPTCASSEVLEAIERLSRDPVPSVRFQIAAHANALYQTAWELMWQIIERICHEEPNSGVLQGVLGTFGPLAGAEPDRIAKLAKAIFDRVREVLGANEVRESCINIISGIYIWRGHDLCGEFVQEIASNPATYPNEAQHVLMNLRKPLTHGPINPSVPDTKAIRMRAFDTLARLLHSAHEGLQQLEVSYSGVPFNEWSQLDQDKVESLVRLIDRLSSEVYFASGAYDSKRPGETMSAATMKPESERFYGEANTIIEELTDIGIPSVARDLLLTLEFFITLWPREVFIRIGRIVRSGQQGGFQYESLAADLIVKIVERYLAEYRQLLKDDGECRQILIEVLDVFVQAGWPSARRLTYRLEEIFR